MLYVELWNHVPLCQLWKEQKQIQAEHNMSVIIFRLRHHTHAAGFIFSSFAGRMKVSGN